MRPGETGIVLLALLASPVLAREGGMRGVRRHIQAAAVTCFPQELATEEFTGCKVLDETKLALHWKIDDKEKFIKFGAMVPGGAWLSLALPTEGGGLVGADVIVLKDQADPARSVFPAPAGFWPGNDTAKAPPVPDPILNEVKSHKTADGATYFLWTRPLAACPAGASILPKRLQRVFWAVSGSEKWEQDELPLRNAPGYDSGVLTKPVEFDPIDSVVITAAMKNATVTAAGQKLCMLFEVPEDVKYHIYDVKFNTSSAAPIREAGLFNCYLQTTLTHQTGQAWDCTDELSLGRCPAVAHYLPGSGVLPATSVLLESLGAAYPLGKGLNKYLVMQVTYDSVPEGGVDSSSAFRMVVSPTLRPNDLGVLVTGAPYSTKHDGLVSDLRIPKHVDEVDYVNSCPVACLGKVMPPNAKMVASRMVMRKLGVSGLVESVSATGTRTMLHYSRTYDPAMPGEELYTTPVPLDPQSTIVTTCVYNSKNAVDEVTAWGQEDCLAVLYYMYPASDKSYGGSCFNTQGATLPASLNEFKDKDVALCTVGKERGFAFSTAHESADMVDGVAKKIFTAKALAARNKVAECQL